MWQYQRGEEDSDREEGGMNEERNDMAYCKQFHLQDTHEETVKQGILPVLEMVELFIAGKDRSGVTEIGFWFPSIFCG